MGWIIALLLILILLAAAYVFALLPNLPRRPIDHLTGFDYAHRGLWNSIYPENSMPGFSNAVRNGFGIELDVHLTKDGQLVVFHDDNLMRMCGVDRDIHDCTLAELRALRLKGSDCTIPTFSEVLSIVGGRVPLIVEIKTGPNLPVLCEKANALLRAYRGPYCMESFDPKAVQWWRDHAPGTIRGLLAHGVRGLPKDQVTREMYFMETLAQNLIARADFIAYGYKTEPNLPMKLMRLLRPTFVAWTVRSQEDMDRLRDQYDLQIFEGFIPKR